ncbi:MAG: ABC-F family ATP-binding cassette domain-containing protein [Planctomycetaceae bacterium]
MAVLLEIRRASKRFGEQVLLDDASATLTDDGKIGFVGRNGAGKSTLLRIILGEEELDSGEVIHHPDLRIGYLRQHDPFLPGESTMGFLERDSHQSAWKCGEVAGRFEIKGSLLEGPVAALSGGWQTRVKLAALLLHEPNLLLLDEPTNFLDLRTQILLEHFLKGFREACLVVSHDRAFLGSTCDQTLALARGKLTVYPGPVDAYLAHDRERREHAERVNATVLAKKRELEEFIARNRARASTASRAKSKGKQLERLELMEVESDDPLAAIRCPAVERRQGPAVRCIDLAIGYPGRTVASGIDLEIVHGSRAAIVGDNGQGKTTFLRSLTGSIEPVSGRIKWGYGCDVGVYAQHVYLALSESDTVLSHLERVAGRGTKSQRILDLAGAMLFRGKAVEKRVGVLSGGERARVCLAGLLLGSHNVLVLDEPGNHLDVETVEALAAALRDYQGTVIFTSHDRSFMHAVATEVVEVGDDRVTSYRGDYGTYVANVSREIDVAEAARDRRPRRGDALERAPSGGRDGRAVITARQERAPRDASSHRDRRKAIARLEKEMSQFEEERKRFERELMAATNADDAMRLHTLMEKAAMKLADAEHRWLELQD